MNIRKLGAAFMAVLMITSGCAGLRTGAGPFNGLGSDYMSMLVIYRSDFQPLTRQEYEAVQAFAKKANITLDIQLSSALESATATGAAGAAAGAAGGASQGAFYSGALVGAAAGYNAVVYGLGYAVNGAQAASYANVYALALITETAIRDAERLDGRHELARIHVVGAFIRSKNNIDSPAKGLVQDWNGPRAGEESRREEFIQAENRRHPQKAARYRNEPQF